jgi:hypothetical protein
MQAQACVLRRSPTHAFLAQRKRETAVTLQLHPATHPDHHLWRNGNVWWVAFTFHFGEREYRVRRSLGTRLVAEARLRRDRLLERSAAKPGWSLSLRFPRGGGGGGARLCVRGSQLLSAITSEQADPSTAAEAGPGGGGVLRPDGRIFAS